MNNQTIVPADERVLGDLPEHGPAATFERAIAENDAWIRGSELDGGGRMAEKRTAIHTTLVKEWAAAQHRASGYDRRFAVVALGGTGRGEMTPASDCDLALLFDEALSGNTFLKELQNQVLYSGQFKAQCGFACQPLHFSMEDVPTIEEIQLNSFLDMRPIYDPDGLSDDFRERIRSTFNPFEHFLHVRGFWKDQRERAAGERERLDRFDIKNDGLRVFLAGIWMLAGKDFVHSHELYRTLDDPRDLDAYYFLLRIRAYIHLRKGGAACQNGGGRHSGDILDFEDFDSFGEMLGSDAGERERFEFSNLVRARLLSARRRVAGFSTGIIERELKEGRRIAKEHPMVLGLGGLFHSGSGQLTDPVEKSRAALSLLLASQQYEVPIDPTELRTTFRNAGDWLVRVPELSTLFLESRGSLAESFSFLSQVDGSEERLFPGHSKFEASFDNRVIAERTFLRGAFLQEKMTFLEKVLETGRARLAEAAQPEHVADPNRKVDVAIEAARLDPEPLAAVKLALKTKRLPVTQADEAVRNDRTRPRHERYASGLSGIPLADYYEPYARECEFPREIIELTRFLVENRRAFKLWAESGVNDPKSVAEFAALCGDETRLRALFVFTWADRAQWESERDDPERWFHSRELYAMAMAIFKPPPPPERMLKAAGYAPDEENILRDFGPSLFGGIYRPYAVSFGSALVRLAEEPESAPPKVRLLHDRSSRIMGIAARDHAGLAASITGALWDKKVGLRLAHFFSAGKFGLALDFFHIHPPGQPIPPDLAAFIEASIREKRFNSEADEAGLPRIEGNGVLAEWREGLCRLQFETGEQGIGLLYMLSYKVYRLLRGNIFGLNAHTTTRNRIYVYVYLSLPDDLPLDQAQAIVAERF